MRCVLPSTGIRLLYTGSTYEEQPSSVSSENNQFFNYLNLMYIHVSELHLQGSDKNQVKVLLPAHARFKNSGFICVSLRQNKRTSKDIKYQIKIERCLFTKLYCLISHIYIWWSDNILWITDPSCTSENKIYIQKNIWDAVHISIDLFYIFSYCRACTRMTWQTSSILSVTQNYYVD